VTCRKIRYRDKIAALLALARTGSKRRAGRPKDEQRVYRCPVCKGWHLTSKR
jgi:hypothetical protein